MGIDYDPHGYQKKAIKFCIERGAAGLLQDPGLGKTSEMYAVYQVLKAKHLVDRALVICPLRAATSTWPDERDKWNDFHDVRVHVLHGADRKALLDKPHDVSVINPEGLGWLFEQMKGRKKWPWQMLIVDESSGFKNSDTVRYRELRPRLHRFKRRFILTGTPAPNGMMDLWSQVFILDLGDSLGMHVTNYRQWYFNKTGYGGHDWVLKDGAEEEIYKKLRPLVLRMAAEDYLKLPPIIYNTIRVDLSEEVRRVYDEMEKELITAVGGNVVTAANAAAATGKCQQIANGAIYVDELNGLKPPRGDAKRKWSALHDEKIKATVDLVEELQGKPCFIGYKFKHDLERLQKVFKGVPYLGGGVSSQRQREIEKAWNAGHLPILLAHPRSCAHGLNLQGVGAAVVWFGPTWNLEDYIQFNRRVWRQGQRERVVVHHIVARNTVDEAVMKALDRKAKTQKALLDALKSYVRTKRTRLAA